MKIQTISSLSLSPYWRGVQANRMDSVQGQLDGACGPYALLNALVMAESISAKKLDKVWNERPDGRTKLGVWQRQCGPLLLHGTRHTDLSNLLDALQPHLKKGSATRLEPVLEKQKASPSSAATLKTLADRLDKFDKPLLLEIRGKNWAHWAVAVGFQAHTRGGQDKLARILTVDSAETVPALHAWNGALSLGYQGERGLRYMTASDSEGGICGIDSAWALA